MHSDGYRADGEVPVHPVRQPAFSIDVTTVTVAAFATFADDTGYVTDAERFGASAVFHANAADRSAGVPVPGTPWWLTVPGATFRAPGGVGTVGLDDHPAVHISHADILGDRGAGGIVGQHVAGLLAPVREHTRQPSRHPLVGGLVARS